MNEKPSSPRKQKSVERTSLSHEAVVKLSGWLEQLSTLPIKVGRHDLVNWLICKQRDQLTSREMDLIQKMFFCPVKALEEITSEVKRSKQNGETIDLDQILMSKLATSKRRRKKKVSPEERNDSNS